MRRISRAQAFRNPAPACPHPDTPADGGSRAANRLPARGFTLIETVIALALCVLVAGAVAASLGVSLRAERQAVLLCQQRRALDQLHLAQRLPAQAALMMNGLQADWETSSAPQVTGEGTNAVPWIMWEVIRIGDPVRRAFAALRE